MRLQRDIARGVVVDAILSFSNIPVYELDVPTWLEERHPVMNVRASTTMTTVSGRGC